MINIMSMQSNYEDATEKLMKVQKFVQVGDRLDAAQWLQDMQNNYEDATDNLIEVQKSSVVSTSSSTFQYFENNVIPHDLIA